MHCKLTRDKNKIYNIGQLKISAEKDRVNDTDTKVK